MRALGFLLALCALLPVAALGQSPAPWTVFSLEKAQAYRCVRAPAPVVVDGKLGEAEWRGAQPIEGFIVPPSMDWIRFGMAPNGRATSQTQARLMWDDRYLYFAAEMQDRDLYCVTKREHDAPFGADDIIELFLKPSDDQPWYWELHIVPSGGTRDYFYARRGAGGEARWKKYDSGLQASVTRVGTFDNWEDRDSKWVAEMRVPWSAFSRWGNLPRPGDTWRFMVSRYDYSVHLEDGVELSAAAPLPWANFHLFEYYPYLVFCEP